MKKFTYLLIIATLSFLTSCRKNEPKNPVADFMFEYTTECNVPAEVNFKNLSLYGSVFRWNFGDSIIEYKENPTHVYSAEGVYTVELTVYGEGGMHSESRLLYIVKQPQIDFTVSDTLINTGDSVYFSGNSAASVLPSSWLWSFGDGYTSPYQNVYHKYNYPGQYNVTLIAVNACGSVYHEKQKLVRVRPLVVTPVVDFYANQVSINAGQAINFTDISSNNPNAWNWSFPGGTPTSSSLQHPQNIIYNTPGVYDVTLTASNNEGSGTLTKTAYIRVNASGLPPVADFAANITTISAGNSITFTDLSLNTPTSWSWTFQGGVPQFSSEQNPASIMYPNAGVYTVTLTASNQFGSNTATKTAYITVQNPLSVAIKKISVLQMPFPQPSNFVNLYYKITDMAATTYVDGRLDAIFGLTPSLMPATWNLNPYFNIPVLNRIYKIELWDRKGMMADIFINSVQFNPANLPNFPPVIHLNQNGLNVDVELQWQ